MDPRKAPFRTGRLVLAAGLAALALSPLAGSAAVARAATIGAGVPPVTSSFYVFGSYIDKCDPTATTECPLYVDAAKEAVAPAGGMTILDFGAPCFEPVTLAWGTQLFNSQSCTPDSVLVTLAQAWLRGYQTNPNRSAQSSYVLVLGTSNSLTAAVPGNALTAPQMASHGLQWFTSVLAPVITTTQGLQAPVTVWAGNDIEESSDGDWYDGPTTAAWVDAYAAASRASKPCLAGRNGMMVDFGDYVPNEPGWSPAAVYHVAWQSAAACPVPQIYLPANAAEWQGLNRYAESAGLQPMVFTGVLSEDGAAGSLASTDSWNNLKSATGQAPPYMSVVGEVGPIPPVVPDRPTVVEASAGRGLVTLAWSAPAWDGGAAITSFTVKVYAGSTLKRTVVTDGLPAPEIANIEGLDTGKAYTFDVSATNRAGTGPASPPSSSAAPSAIFP